MAAEITYKQLREQFEQLWWPIGDKGKQPRSIFTTKYVFDTYLKLSAAWPAWQQGHRMNWRPPRGFRHG